jgi:hypothetical protein
MSNLIPFKPIDDMKHDDAQHVAIAKAQEERLKQQAATITELRAAVGYWQALAEGFGR